MTQFRVRCPKCSSQNVDVYLDRAPGWTAVSGDRRGERVLHCHACGKMMFGHAAVDAEIKRQEELARKAAKSLPTPEPGVDVKALDAHIRTALRERSSKTLTAAKTDVRTAVNVMNGHRSEVARLRQAATTDDAKCAVNLAELDIAQVDHVAATIEGMSLDQAVIAARTCVKVVANFQSRLERASAAVAVGQVEKCSWKDCGNHRRDGSAYCSVECRNKNARWRHAQRKGGADAG